MLSPQLGRLEVAYMLCGDGQFGLRDLHDMRNFVSAILNRDGGHHNARDSTGQIDGVLLNAVGKLHDQNVVLAQSLRFKQGCIAPNLF